MELDGDGVADLNLIRRAEGVAGGVGSMSPVATNKTDEGRAKNRRVELVEE